MEINKSNARVTALHQFIRFCMVGCVGFTVDAMMLEMGILAGLKVEVARVFSVLIAMQVTYALNRAFTFRDAKVKGIAPWVTFLASNALGAAVNYTVFLTALHVLPFANAVLDRQISLVMGTGVALFFNFWANRTFVFKKGGE